MATLSKYENNHTIELNVSQPSKYIHGINGDVSIMLPGMIVGPDILDTGDVPTDKPYLRLITDGIPAMPFVIVENPQEGKGIYDSYAGGEKIKMRVCRRGDIVLAWYTGTATVRYGSYLTIDATTGGIKPWAGSGVEDAGAIVAQAWEVIDSPAASTLLRVMIW